MIQTKKMTTNQKNILRKEIKELKRRQDRSTVRKKSSQIFTEIESLDVFRKAKIILLYWSMDGEVYTHDFIQKYSEKKKILLPVIVENALELRLYTGIRNLKKALRMNLYEPIGESYADYGRIDLAIIPGVAFDKHNNRMGYGKAYYDRLLPNISGYKIGVCFDFQFFDTIPHTSTDVKMDKVIRI